MRVIHVLLGGTALAASAAASAADQLKFGKPPEWVVPQAIPAGDGKSPDAPISVMLTDQQIRLEPGKTVTYAELAMKIQTSQGLAAGNISLPWDPATDTVTVNKLQIRRGSQIIDVLASGQTFTTMRRESNLELAMLDGVLTANIQPEGIQQGDIIDVATTTEHVDPVLGKHVEARFGQWGASPIGLAHLHIDWPTAMPLKVQAKGFSVQQSDRGGRKLIEFSQRNLEPLIPPKGAPARFTITRLGETTDFASWADLAALTAPLYRKAEAIPPTGPLHDEVEKIRVATADPKLRATRALQLVQDRVRYVALLMGQGGYVPADAETTWSRRFGDCKAKTALLLGTLHSLGIEAEPILVQSALGDAIAERLPLLGYFDHVLVRAHIGGKTYYLDGTRTGDSNLDEIDVPDFGWALPVVADAKLVALVPPPLQQPATDTQLVIDVSKGVRAPADVTVELTIRGDTAIAFNQAVGALTTAQRLEFFNAYWKKNYNFVTPEPTVTSFDSAKKIYRLSMHGTGKLDWNTHYFHLPDSTLGYMPDFDRPAGPFHDAPIAVAYPTFTHNLTKVRFPPGFFGSRAGGVTPTTAETLAGVAYRMTVTRLSDPAADTLTLESSERSLAPEIPYKDAVAAASRLRQLADEDVAVPLPSSYQATSNDLAALAEAQPGSASEFITRGNTLMNARKYEQAIADFTAALGLDAKNVTALADRGIAYIWTNKLDLAERDLHAASMIDPENAVVHRARGLKAESAGDCTSAVEAYTRSLTSEPRNGFAFGHRAICENILARHSEALSDAERALEIDPSWGQLHALRLDSFARLGRKDDAAREAEQLVRQSPQTAAAAWIAIGTMFGRAGLKDEAIAAFDKSLAIKPEPSTYVARADIRPSSDFAGRMADVEAALKLEPLDLDALAAKADLLTEKGDFKAALAIYDRAVKAVPRQSPLSVSRGILLYKLGRTAEGERVLSSWRRGALTATELNQLCWKKATAGILLQSALKDCDEALHINPNYVPAIDSLAFLNLRLGNFKEAASLYDRALAKSRLPASYLGRALAYRHLGDSSRATADRSEAIKADADIEARFARYGMKFEDSSAPSR